MNTDIEILIVLDASGSMAGRRNETIASYNEFIEEQKKSLPNATLTLVVFNSSYEFITRSQPIHLVLPLSKEEYKCDGMTALYDAIGAGFTQLGNPDKAFICIITDGQENYSTDFTAEKVKELISNSKEKGYKVLFIGADLDAVTGAIDRLGIDKNDSLNLPMKDEGSMRAVYATTNSVLRQYTGKN